MLKYVTGVITRGILTLFVLSLVVFALARATGDPVLIMLGNRATKTEVARLRGVLGLDQPLPVQYVRFVGLALQGDFGRSIVFMRPAMDMVAERLPATLQLVGASFLLALLIALPIGVYSAARRGGVLDQFGRGFAALGQAVPPFWMGLVLVLLFGVTLHWLPTSGRTRMTSLILPTVTLGWYVSVGLMRLTRSSMLDVLGSEYVKLARIKGMPESTVIWKHAFKNAALPVLTYAGLLLVSMVNAAVTVETVFAWPGLGSLIIESVSNRDFPVIQAGVLLLGALFALSSTVVDLLYGVLNPRIRKAA